MNRHKTFWSTMGIEEKIEKSPRQENFEKLEKQLTIMFNMYDKTDILTLVRQVYEDITK